MSLRILTIIGLLLSSLTVHTQDWEQAFERDCEEELLCPDFNTILREITHYLEEEDGANAYRELKALEACDKCPEHRDNLDDLSDEIIRLFRDQNESLNSLVDEQQQTVASLQRLTRDLRSEREKVNRQLEINEEMTKDALVTNYMRRAEEFLRQESETGIQEARWLTDFTYNYIDSTHHDVHRMMHSLFNRELLDYYAYEPEEITFDVEDELPAGGKLISMDWSPNGNWLAVGMDNGRLLIFDAEGEVSLDINISDSPIRDVQWNSESRRLAFVQNTFTVAFIDLASDNWSLQNEVLKVGSEVGTLRWSPTEANKLAVTNFGTDIYVYEGITSEPSLTISDGHNDWIRDLAWSPDGEYFVTCDDQGFVVKWQAKTGTQIFQRAGHSDYVRSVDWHPDGEYFISGGDDGLLVFWTADGEQHHQLSFDGWIYQARYSASGDEIGVNIGEVLFVRVTADDRTTVILPTGVTRFAWRNERSTGDPADDLRVGEAGSRFDIPAPSQAERNRLSADESMELGIAEISKVAWSPDGLMLAFCKENRLGIVFEDKVVDLQLDNGQLLDLDWHPGLSDVLPYSNQLVTVSADQRIVIWDAVDLSVVKEKEMLDAPLAVAWSPRGDLLAATTTAGDLVVFNSELEVLLRRRIADDFIRSIQWSPNGRRLLMGSDDNSVTVFDWSTQTTVQVINEHFDWVRKVLWLDNNHFISCSDDSRTVIWRANDGQGNYQMLHELTDVGDFHVSADFLPAASGGLLAVGSTSSQIGRWILDENYRPTLDTIVETQTVAYAMDWQPGTENLVVGGYYVLPQQIDRYLQTDVAYAGSQKMVEVKVPEELAINRPIGPTAYVYLPRMHVQPGRYDQLAWSGDDRYLAFIDAIHENEVNNHVELHNLETGALERTIVLPDADIDHLAMSPNGRYLAVAPQSDYCVVVGGNGSTDSLRMTIGADDIMDWRWSPDGRYLAVLHRNYEVFRCDMKKRIVESFATGINDFDRGTVLFHPQRSGAIFVVNRHGVYELSAAGEEAAEPIYTVPAEDFVDYADIAESDAAVARAMWLDRDGRELLYVSSGVSPTVLKIVAGGVKVKHQMGDPENIYAYGGTPRASLYELHPLNSEKYDFKSKDLEYARIWDVPSGEPAAILRDIRLQLVSELDLSRDGTLLAALGDELIRDQGTYNRGLPVIRIWETENRRKIFEMKLDGTQHLQFSPQGKYLITYFDNGQIGLWPLELPPINRYLANPSKDLYLERFASKDNQPLLERIVEWELEKGINFKAENFDLIRRRESARIRRNWGEYYVDKAWLNRDPESVENSFERARELHYVPGRGQRIRPTTTDTLALIDSWVERAYYAIGQNDEQSADEALLNAQRLRPGMPRLQLLNMLLDWQEGRRQDLIQTLMEGETSTLTEEYKNWDRRDIHLRDELLTERLIAIRQQRYDPVSPLEKPTMKTYLQDVDPIVRDQLLFEYYRKNITHPRLIYPGARSAFLEEIRQFLETDRSATEASAERLELYLSVNKQLQDLELDKGKVKNALKRVEDNLRIVELLLAENPDNQDYQWAFLGVQADRGKLQLRADARDAAAVAETLSAARRRYPELNARDLEIQLVNARLVQGEEAAAFREYYDQLEYYSFDHGQLIVNELREVDQAAFERMAIVLEQYEDYRETRETYWQEKPFFTTAGLAADPPDLSEVQWEDYEQLTRSFYTQSLELDRIGLLPKDSLARHLEEYNRSVGDRIYLMLFAREWEAVSEHLERFRSERPQVQWPQAVNAMLAVLKDEWPSARRLLSELKNLPNDGIRTDEYPTLRDFLLNPPPAVLEAEVFQKRWEDWQGRLEE